MLKSFAQASPVVCCKPQKGETSHLFDLLQSVEEEEVNALPERKPIKETTPSLECSGLASAFVAKSWAMSMS